MEHLIFVEGAQKGQRYPLEGEKVSLGRDRNNDIPLSDPGASRQHALIIRDRAGWLIRDLGSTNGTMLNSRRIKEERLEHGQHIQIGESIILFQGAAGQKEAAGGVVLSEAESDIANGITISMDSTVLLSPQALLSAQTEVQQQIRDLFSFVTSISGILDLQALLRRGLMEIVRIISADRGAVLLLSRTSDLVAKAIYPENMAEVVVSRTISDHVLKTRQGLLSNPGFGIRDSLRQTASIAQRDVGSVLCVPLFAEDHTLGLVYLENRATSKLFNERLLHLLSAMSMQLAIMIQNANLYRGLRNAEEFASCILKSVAAGLIVVDNRGNVLRANEAACDLLGMAMKDILGMPITGAPALRDLARLIEETRIRNIPVERAEVIARVGERDLPLGVNTSLLEDYAGNAIGIVCLFRDLTRWKKLEEEVRRAQRLASLGEMAAGIAHEVRNPLNAVQGFAQILQEEAAKRGDATATEYCRIILEEVGRIDRIVQDMLDFARQRELTMAAVELDDLLRGLQRQLQPEAEAAKVALRLKAAENRRFRVVGNADKLKQLFLNIVRNAIQACSAGGKVEVCLELAPAAAIYPEAVVHIRDDGCGIPAEIKEKIFNPFFTTKDVGTGLGLAICQKIVEQHSGRIEVESQPGLGSVFSVYLPLRE